MYLRSLAASAALLLAAAPVLAEPPKPAVVVQVKPVSRLLADSREMVRQAAGPDAAERALKEFDKGLKELLGEQGFEGLDVNRPLGAYVVLRDDIADTSATLVVPITGEKEFIALLGRMRLQTEAVKDKKGVYKLILPDADVFPKDSHVHITGQWAYVSVNAGAAADAKDLVPAFELFDNADPALVSAKLYPERVPEKLAKTALDQLDMAANGIKGFLGAGGGAPPHIAKLATTFFEDGPKLVRRYVETGRKEAAEVAVRFRWNPESGDTITELTVTPKAGTPLAKDIAASSVSNRFAGIIPKDAAVGVIVKAPLFAPEIRNIVVAALEAGQVELKSEPGGFPRQFHPIVDEVAKSFIGSVKKGQFDAAVALAGPDKGGKFTLVGGVSLDNAAAVEKALRDLVKGRDFAKLVQLDAAKAGTVNIHKVELLGVFPERDRAEFAKVFGADAPGYVAFDKDAVFVALGPDALPTIKAAIEAKPGPAPLLDVVGNMKRLHAMVAAGGGERDAAEFAKMMGTDDKTASMVSVNAEGGQKLTVKVTMNVRFLPKMLMSSRGAEARPVPPPVIK